MKFKFKDLSVKWVFYTRYSQETREHLQKALLDMAQRVAAELAGKCFQALKMDPGKRIEAGMNAIVATDFIQDGKQAVLLCHVVLTRGKWRHAIPSCEVALVVGPAEAALAQQEEFARHVQESGNEVTIVERMLPPPPQL